MLSLSPNKYYLIFEYNRRYYAKKLIIIPI